MSGARGKVCRERRIPGLMARVQKDCKTIKYAVPDRGVVPLLTTRALSAWGLAEKSLFLFNTNDMEAADFKFNLIDTHLGLLRSLSPENKLELISKLSDSLKGCKKPTDKSISDLYGAFISKKSADEILSDLKASRNFKQN